MNINILSLKEQKEVFNHLLSCFNIKNYEIDDLSVKNGKVVKFSRGYGPYDDEWFEVSANRNTNNVVAKLKLLKDLDRKIEEGEHRHYSSVSKKIDELALGYTEEDLLMD